MGVTVFLDSWAYRRIRARKAIPAPRPPVTASATDCAEGGVKRLISYDKCSENTNTAETKTAIFVHQWRLFESSAQLEPFILPPQCR